LENFVLIIRVVVQGRVFSLIKGGFCGSVLPTGHDAWVGGSEPVVVADFQGMIDYAKNGFVKDSSVPLGRG
jgi:hypothetical protein